MLSGGLYDFDVPVNITIPLTLASSQPVQLYPTAAATGRTLLTIASNFTLSGDLTFYSAALRIVDGGRVTQQGALTVVPPGGVGVQVEQGGAFIQQGTLAISVLNNATTGMFCEGEWLQLGSFNANSSASEQPCVQTPRGCLDPFTVWVFGRWTQNGTVNIAAAHVAAGILLGEWVQNGRAQLSVFANQPQISTAAVAALMVANGVWQQKAALDLVASRRNALYLGEVGSGWIAATLWQQDAPVNLQVLVPMSDQITANPYSGVEMNSPNMFWNQNADVTINLQTANRTRAFNCKAQGSWNVQQGTLSINPPEASSLGSCVRTLAFVSSNSSAPDSEQPVLRFNTTNTLQIVPKVTSDLNPDQFAVVEEATVGLGFASITEVAANGTHLQAAQVLSGAWSVLPSNSLGASQAFVFKSTALVNNKAVDPLQRPCILEMEVFLFDEATNVTIGDLASFTVLPALTKVALRVSSWPWLSTSSRLEVRLAVSPAFTNVTYPSAPPVEEPVATKRQGASSSGLTSLLLGGQRSSDGKRALTTEVRFVSVVEIDGVVVQAPIGGGRAPVEFDADVESSSLVLSFGYFASNMSYDPDLGVLVGRRDRDGSSSSTSDDNTWVIAVSVAVPLAVVAVVAVIAVGLVALALQKRRRTKGLKRMLSATRADDV